MRLANENILGAKCLVKVNKGKSVMRLINPTERNIQIKGNKVLAVVSQVEKVNIFMLDDREIGQTEAPNQNSGVTSPKITFDLDNADLNEQQKGKLRTLLNKNSDIFF